MATPKRRWYQFSLRTMFVAMVAASIPLTWWSHRNYCLTQIKIHANRNFAATGLLSPLDQSWRPSAGTYHFGSKDGSLSYILGCEPTAIGHNEYFVEVERGVLPEHAEEARYEMVREARLAEEYSHAIWRPWERLWIKER